MSLSSQCAWFFHFIISLSLDSPLPLTSSLWCHLSLSTILSMLDYCELSWNMFYVPRNFNKNMTKFTENFPSVILQPTFIIYISHESRWIYPHFANKYHIQYFENPTTNNASSPSSRKFQTRSWHCKFFFIIILLSTSYNTEEMKNFLQSWRLASGSSQLLAW